MKRAFFANKKKMFIALLSLVLILAIGLLSLSIYSSFRLSRLESMSFEDVLLYTTRGREDAHISVGIIKDGEFSVTVYGENGMILPADSYEYEIGSLTKTFTAALISKAVSEGRLRLYDTIDMYLPLESLEHYPTIFELATHTSGYKEYYFEPPMVSNYFGGGNPYFGITGEVIIKRIEITALEDKTHSFNYSNFGMAVLGLVLEEVYQDKYSSLLNTFCFECLGLKSTRIPAITQVPSGAWLWDSANSYMPAGALISTIDDMLLYAQMNLDGTPSYLISAHDSLVKVDASQASFKKMGINIDGIGISWIHDNENGIVWHNGGTSNYNSYMGFIKEQGIAVVVMSNLPPDYRVPSTVMGLKLIKQLQNG